MRTWFITGASRGFGRAIAAQAVAAGDSVVATARDPQEAASSLGNDPRLMVLPLDVTNEQQARDAVAAALERFGRIDVLVNNAGYGLVGAVEEASGLEVERLFATNVFGLLNVTRAVLPAMRSRRSGHVIHMSSVGGYSASSGFGIYCASKFAVEGIAESMRLELAPLGVRVTLVEPGYFRTDFLHRQSLALAARTIDDYAPLLDDVRAFAVGADGQQPGDPERLAAALREVIESDDPPLRLALGPDAVRRIEDKHRAVAAEVAAWRHLAMGTGFLR
ncbi:oxidoreductase [Variovorax sp. LjRoot290]|uniref:oxidoreductase n=1 Tax=Variovorax sp. LjRoot290 TaxID=3342316 RepID=UPI003ECDD83C